MRALVITPELEKAINNLVSYAEKHVVSTDDLLDMKNGAIPPIGDNENHVLNIEGGYRVVYSIENQPTGAVRHLSVSVDAEGKLAGVWAVQEFMRLIGFENGLEDCMVAMEQVSDTNSAVNVLEIVK